MSGDNQKTPAARYKLIKTFWWLVRESAIGEENARAVVERLYNKQSLKLLSTDELKNVVDKLIALTKIQPHKPQPKTPNKKREVAVTKAGNLVELPTAEQLAMIEFHADRMKMTEETLRRLIWFAGKEPQLNVMSARKLIEMLKAMHGRGWMDTKAEKPLAPAGRDN